MLVNIGDKVLLNGKKTQGTAVVVDTWRDSSDGGEFGSSLDTKSSVGYPQIVVAVLEGLRAGHKVWCGVDDFRNGVARRLMRYSDMDKDAGKDMLDAIQAAINNEYDIDEISDGIIDHVGVEFPDEPDSVKSVVDVHSVLKNVIDELDAQQTNSMLFVELSASVAHLLDLVETRRKEFNDTQIGNIRESALHLLAAMENIVDTSIIEANPL